MTEFQKEMKLSTQEELALDFKYGSCVGGGFFAINPLFVETLLMTMCVAMKMMCLK